GVDEIYGGEGDDWLRGNAGDGDILNGGAGDDTYVFGAGDGDTVIHNQDSGEGRVDVLHFLEGIEPGDIEIGRSNYDLHLTLQSSGEVITVVGFFLEEDGWTRALNLIQFEDGTRWDTDSILARALQGSEASDTIFGYSSADTIEGLAGNDTLVGGDGDDTLLGGEGDDLLYGGDGDDHLEGNGGNLDRLSGEAGDDYLVGGEGNNTLNGGDGDDTLVCGRGSCIGEAGNDTYIHAAGSGDMTIDNNDPDATSVDVLILDGVDPASVYLSWGDRDELILRYRFNATAETITLLGYFKQDATTGQTIDQIIFRDHEITWDIDYIKAEMQRATEGSDSLYCFAEGNTLHGLAGNDNLYGAAGDDQLFGDAGRDYIDGAAGDDSLDGGADNDRLYGGDGADTLAGGSGDDSMAGGKGADRYLFNLGDGHDTISEYNVTGMNSVNRLVFGDGITREDLRFTYASNDGLRIVLPGGDDSVTLEYYFSTLPYYDEIEVALVGGEVISREEIVAQMSLFTDLDDYYQGTDSADSVHMLQGNDTAYGGDGDDELFGDTGDDGLYGQAGNDQLNGGPGNDYLEGGLGDDNLSGGEGADVLYGNSGDDTLRGDAGEGDTLIGGAGNDTYLYGAGDGDTIISNNDYSEGRYDVLRFLAGIEANGVSVSRKEDDLLLSLQNSGEVITLSGFFLSENNMIDAVEFAGGETWTREQLLEMAIQGTEGDDVLLAYGTGSVINGLGGDDTLEGDAGDDQLSGGAGDDNITGAAGNDTLDGGSGNDDIFGREGDDLLIGGDGDDYMTGGYGDDVLDGGGGSNTLNGMWGSDTYLIGLDAGENLIRNFDSEAESYDRIVFAQGITPQSVQLSRSDYSLLIEVSESLTTVDRFFLNRESTIDALEFHDGPIWSAEDVRSMLFDGNDTDQIIMGYETDDLIDGGGGNDTLNGLAGDDILIGGSGNDQLEGDGGNDIYRFSSGDGQDTIVDAYGLNAIEYIDLASTQIDATRLGDDLILTDLEGGGQVTVMDQYTGTSISSSANTIQEIHFADGVVWDAEAILDQISQGSVGDDVLNGTAEPDNIAALAGNDDIFAYEGDDRVDGGPGDDYLMGDSGSDLLLGGADNDFLFGQEGNDYLQGGAGNDFLFGHQYIPNHYEITDPREYIAYDEYGWDTWNVPLWIRVTRPVYDVLHGGEGSDVVIGTGELYGGAGDDRLMGSGALYGGAGNDTLTIHEMEYWIDDRVNGAYESIYLEASNNSLMVGGRGDDTLTGDYRGRTTFYFELGDGQDTLINGKTENNDNTVLFGEGITTTDVNFRRGGTDLIVQYGEQGDQITLTDWFEQQLSKYHRQTCRFEFADGSTITPEEVDQLFGANIPGYQPGEPPGDVVDQNLVATEGQDHLWGHWGNDTLRGNGGKVTLDGLDGNDTYLYGVEDGDTFIDNSDIYDHGSGRDVLRFLDGIAPTDIELRRDRENLIITVGGNEITVISYFLAEGVGQYTLHAIEFTDGPSWSYEDVLAHLTLGTAESDALYGDSGADQLDGLAGDDSLYGARGDDNLAGGEGADVLYGQDGKDTLNGDEGEDNLQGGAGDDTLIGGEGADRLFGGLGNDTLRGGAGDDEYSYSLGHGMDVIDNTGGGVDTLSFLDITAQRLGFSRDGDDLVIWVDGDISQSVRVTNHFLGGDAAIHAVSTSEGGELLAADLATLLTSLPTADNGTEDSSTEPDEDADSDTTTPDSEVDAEDTPTPPQPGGNDSLIGSEADETLIAGAGSDTLSGGLGNDRLLGGEGDDTYIYSGGEDSLEETAGIDHLRFENGISFSQVASSLLKSGDDLVLQVDGGPDQITLCNFFLGGDHLLETIEFASGGALSAEQIFEVFGLSMPA
ncbi:MAG: calcium-binding protein, partial [Candidatus Thiodiazotropha sp.]